MRNITRGSRIRIRWRSSEDVNGVQAVVEAPLILSGEPGVEVKVWELTVSSGPGAGGRRQYMDLADPELILGLPCEFVGFSPNATAPPRGDNISVLEEGEEENIDGIEASHDGSKQESRPIEWPGCIESGMSTLSGAGLFLNLEALGKKEGCFQEDCSHSDHFATGSPADCARTCAKIGACRTWTFWEAAPSTCWLRGAVSGKPVGQAARPANLQQVP